MLPFLPQLSALRTSQQTEVASGLLVAFLAVSLAAIAYHRRSPKPKKPQRDGRPLPQPTTTLPLLGNTLDFIQNNNVFHDWLSALAHEFDSQPFVLTAPGRPDIVVISTPEAFEDVTKTQYENFGKGEYLFELLHDLLGKALTIVDGDTWRHQRKIFANLFSARALRESMAATIQKHALTMFSLFDRAADSGERLDLFRLLNRFTMESFAEIGFGIQMGSLASGEDHPFETVFDDAQEISARRFSLPKWFWKVQRLLGIGSEGRLQTATQVIDSTVLRFISESVERRARGETSTGTAKNIVSLVLDSSDIKDEVDPELLRSIVIAAMVAGRDTSAQTLSWFIYMLSQHPEVESRVRNEVLEEIPRLTSEPGYFPTMEEVQSLTYLEAAIKETLRLYPAASFNLKHCEEDTFLSDGTFIPGGAQVGLPYYAMGRMARIWGPDCEDYKPERFLDPETGKPIQMSPFKFNAFHAGPRICLGMNLAMMEMKIVVAGLLSRFHISVEPGQEITYVRSISLPMKNPFMVHIERVAAPVA